GLCPGTYTATVSNAACGTSVQQIVTINSIGTIAASLTASTNILCNGGNTGSATASTSAGNPPFTYSWNSVPVQNTATATNLTAGSYTCTVTSVDGCTTTVTVTLTEPPALSLATSGIPNTCNNSCDGQLIVIPSGGTTPYSFLWTTGCTNPSCSNICAGNYSITVTDANGCVITNPVAVTQPTAITQNLTSTTAHCSTNDGTATTVANGGAGGYTYNWLPAGGTNATANNLNPGTYTCTVTDASGCTNIDSVVVANTPGVSITSGPVTNVTCNGACNGSLSITGNGGTPPYTYLWAPSGGNTPNATNLCAGTYTCTLTDVNGCTNTVSLTVTEPSALTVTTPAVPPVICNGSTTNLSATGAGGTGPYTYLWQPGGLSGNAPTVTPTVPTTYTVTVTDANGCTNTATELIVVNPTPLAALSGLPLNGCAPLTVVFTDNSTVTPPAVVTNWLWNFGDGDTSTFQSPTHTYQNAGNYTVTLTIISTGGCTGTITLTNYVTVDPDPVAGFSASPQPTNILEATITFTDQSTGATSWQWNFGDIGNSTSTLQNPVFQFPDTGCYLVQQVVTDANSCTDTATAFVCIDPDWAIYVPNAFTPNGDGINDVFMPLGVGIQEDHYEFWIFDRWGNLIFYTDDFHKGWDGIVKGGAQIAQIDTYVWKIRCRDVLGGSHKYIGKVSLIK
ncbi:MAG TPA: PKD domain-containing protein, partial [Bacteroidia bacterium]|nr:PKD domain-containing protein [Bacteroidia bacterium]